LRLGAHPPGAFSTPRLRIVTGPVKRCMTNSADPVNKKVAPYTILMSSAHLKVSPPRLRIAQMKGHFNVSSYIDGFVPHCSCRGGQERSGRRYDRSGRIGRSWPLRYRSGSPGPSDEANEKIRSSNLFPFAGARRNLTHREGETATSAYRCSSTLHWRSRYPFLRPSSAIVSRNVVAVQPVRLVMTLSGDDVL
jgi:hypothetical protein